MKRFFISLLLLISSFSLVFAETVETFITPGVVTWTCPIGVTSVKIECWGAGACGAGQYGYTGGIGGGGGAYSRINSYIVSSGAGYTLTIGVTGSPGGDTSFKNGVTTVCLAKGGNYSVGGAAASCTGDVKYSGGSGGSTGMYSSGSGGGSSAGTESNGNDGLPSYNMSYNPGAGGSAPVGGAAGGSGGSRNGGQGNPPPSFGGGGGGGAYPGGAGSPATNGYGQIILTYTITATAVPCVPIILQLE